MEPHIVTEAPMPPGQCVASQDQEGPWIDTGLRAPWVNPYIYLGTRYIESLARDFLGMVSGEEVDLLKDQVASYETRLQELQAFVDATVAYQDARDKELVK